MLDEDLGEFTVKVEKEPKLEAVICRVEDVLVVMPSDENNYTVPVLNHKVYRLLVKYKKSGYWIVLICHPDTLNNYWENLDSLGLPVDEVLSQGKPVFKVYEMFKEKYDVELAIETDMYKSKRWIDMGIDCLLFRSSNDGK